MKFSTALSGYEGMTRRLALRAAERADAMIARRSVRRILSEPADAWPLGAEAGPGPVTREPPADGLPR
jgi:hypothetical protein